MTQRDRLGRAQSVPAAEKDRLEAIAARLGRGKDLRHRFIWPGGTVELELQVLSLSEMQQAETEALAEAQAAIGDGRVTAISIADFVVAAKVKHMMFFACKSVGGDSFFETVEDLAETATEDEIAIISNIYFDHKQSIDPEFEALADAQLAVIDEAIKKKDSSFLRSTASDLPKSSLLILVDRLVTSLLDSSTST